MTSDTVYAAPNSNAGWNPLASSIGQFARTCASAGLVLALLFAATPAPAQDAVEPGRFSVGFEQRVRSDDWNNAIDMSDRTNDQRDQLRDRTRLWMLVPVTGFMDVQVGAAMENTQRAGTPKRFDEGYLDQASVNFRKLFIHGLSLKVGRQDIMKGEGFVIFDGTPGDGPRSGYYNAADLSYVTGKSQVELIGMFDPASDRFLPRWHNQSRLLQNWDEQAVGAYFTNKSFAGTTIESYYFLKKEVHDVRAPSNPQFQPDRHVGTLGGRLSMKLTPHTECAGEYAHQWGAQHGGAVIRGWGGYSWAKHTLDRPLHPYVKLGYWVMSGDDPNTRNKVEGWDPIFSQWPKWSDVTVYAQSKEVGIAYWTNLRMTQVEAGFAPVRKTTLAFIWYHMDSLHPFAGSTATFGQGTARGENYQVRLDFSPYPSWKAYIHYESHCPGDFYAATRSAAYEVQAQVTYRFAFHPLNGLLKSAANH